MSLAIDRSQDDEPELDVYSPFWPRSPEASSVVPFTGRNPALDLAVLGGLLAFKCNNHPTDANIAEATAWNPGAEDLLSQWKEVFDRSFPDGLPDYVTRNRNEGVNGRKDPWFDAQVAEFRKRVATGNPSNAADSAYWIAMREKVDSTHALAAVGGRNWRAHVVDDAETIASLRHAVPGETWVTLGDALLVLERHDPDGLPVLATAASAKNVLKNVLSRIRPRDDAPYWTSPAFLAAAGRGFAVSRSSNDMAMILASMARQGHRKAFLKGVASKSGTWTVDLEGVEDPAEALVRYNRAVAPWLETGKNVVVQEHVPFLKEQRFFVVGGRVVASVCSDRHHCAVDARRDRILDERVATIAVPESGAGPYDRGLTGSAVDRKLSAAFARGARRLARALADEGTTDYVLDMGLTERGVLPVELNSLYMSGPYSLSRRRIVEARARLRTRAYAMLDESIRHRLSENPKFLHDGVSSGDVRSAVAAMPLSDIAGAVVDADGTGGLSNGRTTTRRSYASHSDRDQLDRLIRETTTGIAARRRLDEVERIRSGFLEKIGFALMPDCEPLFSVPFAGRRGSGVDLCAPDASDDGGPTMGTLCCARLDAHAGPVLAAVSVVLRDGRATVSPVADWIGDPEIVVRDDRGTEQVLVSDSAGRDAVLVRGPDGDVVLEMRTHAGSTSVVALPKLRMEPSGRIFLARWRVGAGLPELPWDQSDEDDVPTLGYDDDGPDYAFDKLLDDPSEFDPFVEPIGTKKSKVSEAFDPRLAAASDARRGSGDISKTPPKNFSPWQDLEGLERMNEEGSSSIFATSFSLPGTGWTDGALAVKRVRSDVDETNFVVWVAARRDGVWDVGRVDYSAPPPSEDAEGIAAAVRRSADPAKGILVSQGSDRIALRMGYDGGRGDQNGHRRPVATIMLEGVDGRVLAYREHKTLFTKGSIVAGVDGKVAVGTVPIPRE